ncbi:MULTISPECIES: hypothetical protein [unclassified Synechocystis]|uniref:hypothetical protein n=1 Tax=unclassified Synechocystis TaxID=2640012 RepID=UPI00048CA389|nr:MULTISPECIES: hypothetical protein [unclassified Synechocystis]MCT0254534.1 hypothetical protein [Synechocystis sp. CS-94]
MELSSREGVGMSYMLVLMKSFSVWTFTLLVCLLVVGFPLVFVVATVGVLATVVLQSVLPMSAVLLVASSLLGGTILLVLSGAATLTLKGIHPQEVRWLSWLHGETNLIHKPMFASCPLTCSLIQ